MSEINDMPVKAAKKRTKAPAIMEAETTAVKLDDKVLVTSIAPWQTGFARKLSTGDITFAPNGVQRLSREEIIAQIQDNNRLFTGIDGRGSHATLYVHDDYVLNEVDFDNQSILDDVTVKNIYTQYSGKDFEDAIKAAVVTRAEKYALIMIIRKLKLNDYAKNRCCEDYTGYHIG